MNKFLKITAQIFGLLIVLYIALMVLLYAFVQTKYPQQIIGKTFYEVTGQTLRIDGKIRLSVFPWPGINASNITIENPKKFKAPARAAFLAKIGRLRVRLRVIPLIRGNILPASILLDKVRINLVTAANGKTNWENFLKSEQPLHSDKTGVTSNKANELIKSLSELPIIEIRHVALHLINLQTKQETQIRELQILSTPNRHDVGRSITLSCELTQTSPNIKIGFRLAANLNTDLNTSTIKLSELELASRFYQLKHKLTRPIELLLRGSMMLRNGNLTSMLHGNFAEGEVKIHLSTQAKNNNIMSRVSLKNVHVSPIVQILTGKDWLNGKMNGATTLKSRGKTLQNWISSLSGNGRLAISNGKIHGLNMVTMVSNTLDQLLNPQQQKQSANQEGSTAFNTISVSYKITSGILRSNDFLIDAPKLKAAGNGVINLPRETIKGRLLATYADNPKWQIPLVVSGSLFNPVLRPDTAAIAKEILKSKYKKEVGNIFDETKQQLKGLFN